MDLRYPFLDFIFCFPVRKQKLVDIYKICKTFQLEIKMKLKDLLLQEAEETQISKKVADLVKRMEKLTTQKKKNECLGELAKFLTNKKWETVLDSIQEIEKQVGSLPYGVMQYRNELQKDILALAKQRLNGKEYEAVLLALG